MICMDHAAGSLGASWASGHKTLCLLQMPGNSTNAKWTPKPAVLVAAEEGKGRPLAQGMIIRRVTKACHRRLWHRCRWCRWRWQQARPWGSEQPGRQAGVPRASQCQGAGCRCRVGSNGGHLPVCVHSG